MARRNPDKAKELFYALSKEIATTYGEEGKQELEELYESLPPTAIFALPLGPDRDARIAQLITNMREISRELAEARAARVYSDIERRERDRSKPKKKEPKKKPQKEKPTDVVGKSMGQIEGFSFAVYKLRNGLFLAKVSRKGRNVIEDERAPSIYDSPRLRRAFKSSDEAEFAIKRVINTALMWYDERGVPLRDRARKSKKAAARVGRRTPEIRAALKAEAKESATILRKKARAEARAERLRQEKVSGRRRGNPERSLKHIPRANPSKMFAFSHSEKAAEKQAGKSLEAYVKHRDKWKESLDAGGRPRFIQVLKAYDALENARANFVLAGRPDEAKRVDQMHADLRQEVVDIFNTCYRHLSNSSRAQNPGPETHEKIGLEMLAKAEHARSKHKESGSSAQLLDAYKYYEIAKKELKYSGDSKNLKKATEGAKKIRAELRKAMRG